MALLKLKDFDPNYRQTIVDDGLIGFSVYAGTNDEKIGTVKDILVDETTGKFRYLIVDLGFWIFGKKVLLPIGLSRIDFTDEHIYAKGLTQGKRILSCSKNMVYSRAIFPPLSLLTYAYRFCSSHRWRVQRQ